MKIHEYECPMCGILHPSPFLGECPSCGFNVKHLTGKSLSDFQEKKKGKHSGLLTGAEIPLYGGKYNASFDHNGDTSIEDLVKFTISFGDRNYVRMGDSDYVIIVSYVPEIIGTGTSVYLLDDLPCSGVAIVSPENYLRGHVFPALDLWVRSNFSRETRCATCGKATMFGQPFCSECYSQIGGDWRDLVKGGGC